MSYEFFLPQSPTYLEAAVVKRGFARMMVEAGRKANQGSATADYEWVSIPLHVHDGYPRNTSLVLFRMRKNLP